ncbi:hypothetical protein B0H11DRAFT_1691621, partial [Mycena galericulata]
GNRRHIATEQKDLIIIMAARRTPGPAIAAATGIHLRTVRRTIATWRDTGRTLRIPLELGRPRILTALNISFLEGLIERTPDIYTFELQNALATTLGLEVSKNTIRLAL